MTKARQRALLFLLVAAIAVAATALVLARQKIATPSKRPTLLLLTSLPLIFNEQFALSGGGSPALKVLQDHYRVVPISVASVGDLAKGRLVVMAQPPAQTAENLVALDDWVRGGGQVLLFADPLLEWPSRRPLGDPLRPPPMFADTGLLAHWGLRLDSPEDRGPAFRNLAGQKVLTVSPGALYGGCTISPDRLVADCRLARGRALVVADADLLDVADLGPDASNNLTAVIRLLASVANRRFAESQTYPQDRPARTGEEQAHL